MDGDTKVASAAPSLPNGDMGSGDVKEEIAEKKDKGDSGLSITVNSQDDVEMTEDSKENSEKKDDVQILNDSCTVVEETEKKEEVNGAETTSGENSGEEKSKSNVVKQNELNDVVESEKDSPTADVTDCANNEVKTVTDHTDKEQDCGVKDTDGGEKKQLEEKPSEEKGKGKAEADEGKVEDEDKTSKKDGCDVKEKEEEKDCNKDGEKETSEPDGGSEVITPSKNLRKRKRDSNGYKEDETSSDEDYKDMIVEKKPKLPEPVKPATEKSVSVPVAALDKKTTPIVPLAYNVGQPVSLVGANLLQNQQVRMVIPSVSNNILSHSGQPLLISQPQTSILTTQGLTLNPTGVVLYPQLQPGSASAVMSNMLTTAAQKVNNTKPSYEISIVGVSNAKTVTSRPSAMVTSVTTANNKPVAKIDKIDLRPPSNSQEMIQLVKWELKQGVYHRPKNFRIKPDSELGPMAKFLRDFGQDLVKESVYNDLVNIQSRRSDHGKLTDKEKKDFQKLKSVHAELKEKVGPVKTPLSRKCQCGFKTESSNVMFWHKQHPHVEMNELKCGLCDFESRESSSFTFHMEAEHGRKAKFIEKPAFWACNLCPYETNLRNKLTQHRFRCVKTFKLSLNLHPAWLPGPEANYCLEKIFYKNPVVANMNRLQQQQQQQHSQRPVMPIMPKGPASQTVKSMMQQSGKQMKTIPFNHMNKGPTVNTQAMRNPTLLAKLGQNMQKQQGNVYQTKQNYVPNVNLFQGQKTPQLAAHLMSGNMSKKSATNVTYVRQPNTNVSAKINSIISMNNQVLDKGGQNNKPSGFEVCEICGGYVKDRTALRIHFFYAHRIDMPHGVFDRVHPPLYCATCFARFWTAQGLQKHLDVHKEDSSGGVAGKCIVCLHRVPNILMHMKIVHNKAFVNFLRECKCIFCGLKFPSKTVVESHMAAVHGVVVKSGSQPTQSPAQGKKQANLPKGQKGGKNDLVKGSVCVLCNLNFGRNVDLTRHCMRVHHTCMKCGMVVADKESLMRHSCLESPSGLRNCEICKEKGFHPAYHVKHIRDKHLRKLSIKVKRLDRRTLEKWTKKTTPWSKRQQIPLETIELSDDDEPYAKRVKVDEKDKQDIKSEQTKDVKKADASTKKTDEVVMLTDDEDDKKDDKPNDPGDVKEKDGKGKIEEKGGNEKTEEIDGNEKTEEIDGNEKTEKIIVKEKINEEDEIDKKDVKEKTTEDSGKDENKDVKKGASSDVKLESGDKKSEKDKSEGSETEKTSSDCVKEDKMDVGDESKCDKDV